MFAMTGLMVWCKALFVVMTPFIKMITLWMSWQLGIGALAWSTARFYGINCAPPGFTGFMASLFAMGNPICVSAWFSHGAFVVAYITSFIATILISFLWLWKKTTAYPMIQNLREEIQLLKKQIPKSVESKKLV